MIRRVGSSEGRRGIVGDIYGEDVLKKLKIIKKGKLLGYRIAT